jgi:hypothetical protein
MAGDPQPTISRTVIWSTPSSAARLTHVCRKEWKPTSQAALAPLPSTCVPVLATWQLLEEAVEDFLADMKRRAELGLTDAAITMCRGMVAGLYRARSTASDGPLGWAPDFPAEEAGHAVAELLRASSDQSRRTIRARLVDAIVADAPDWREMLTRAASEER